MRYQISKKISLVIALFAVMIGLSACSNQNAAPASASNTVTSVNYNQNSNTKAVANTKAVTNTKITPTTQNSTIPSPQTRQS